MNIENQNQRARKERMMELAGILKEKGKGSMTTLSKLLDKFAIQEGVRIVTAQEYLSLFKSVGLIKIAAGSKKWEYNEDAEWELFQINI